MHGYPSKGRHLQVLAFKDLLPASTQTLPAMAHGTYTLLWSWCGAKETCHALVIWLSLRVGRLKSLWNKWSYIKNIFIPLRDTHCNTLFRVPHASALIDSSHKKMSNFSVLLSDPSQVPCWVCCGFCSLYINYFCLKQIHNEVLLYCVAAVQYAAFSPCSLVWISVHRGTSDVVSDVPWLGFSAGMSSFSL